MTGQRGGLPELIVLDVGGTLGESTAPTVSSRLVKLSPLPEEDIDDFFDTLTAFCTANNIRQGYIPMFIAGFAEAEIVGTCEKLADPGAPVWSKVHLTNVEALGCGTLGHDPETDRVLPHIHASVGLKEHSALGHTSHLLSARVQFLVEILLVEITTPTMLRTREPALHDVPLLRFSS